MRFSTTDKVNFSNAVSKLLRDFEVLLKDAKPVCDSAFGPVGIVLVTSALQKLIDEELIRMLAEFRKHLGLAKFVAEGSQTLETLRNRVQSPFLARRLFAATQPQQQEEPFSSPDIPVLLQQVSAISQTVESHRQFLAAIIKVRLSSAAPVVLMHC